MLPSEHIVDLAEFRESLLRVMESKQHWGWPLMTAGHARRDRLHVHFEQEYATYVRDFPVLVAWAYVQCPFPKARRELIENVFEEETGGLAAGAPHPELFLEYPRGLGMDLGRFENVQLLPAARVYRARLDDLTQHHGWAVAAAVTTLFLEGTPYERGEVDATAERRPAPPLEAHPLVVHYGLPLDHLRLTRAHRSIEGDHRKAAWETLLDFTRPDERAPVVAAMRTTRDAWYAYRDEISAILGLERQTVG
jgi:hypothetical protein